MKESIDNRTYIQKGISTLDAASKNTRIFLLLLTVIFFNFTAYAGHSTLDVIDPSFNPQIQTALYGFKVANVVIPLPDGKILVGGVFNTYNGQPTGAVVRLNANGTIDPTFDNTTVVYEPQTDTELGNYPWRMLLQSDGKIIIGGRIKIKGQNSSPKAVARLNADGTFDPTFTPYGSNLGTIAIDASNRILIAEYPGYGLVRLKTDGTVDTSFQPDPNHQQAFVVAAQNNKIITFVFVNTQTIMHRLNEDGTLDNTFTPTNVLSDGISNLAIQPDGKILLLGSHTLQRFNENGGADSSFTTINFSSPNTTYEVKVANDGKIVVSSGPPAGPTTSDRYIERFLSNGAIDSSFTPYNAVACLTFGLQPDGGVILGDVSYQVSGTSIQNHFLRLLPNGSLDTSFNVGGIGFQNLEPGNVRAITVQPDGKILVGGTFDVVSNSPRFKVARLNADSTLDTTFQVNTGNTGNHFSEISQVDHIGLQSDGKILLSGDFQYLLNGVQKQNLVRLNPDGSIDPTFTLGNQLLYLSGSFNSRTNKTAELSDGKIIVGTSRYDTQQVPLKLNADGTRDNSFTPTIYSSRTVHTWDLAIQPDGKIIIGGTYLASVNPPALWKSFIVRLNADGSTDQTFQYLEAGNAEITAFVLLPSGKILASRSWINDPNSISEFFQLNADGSLDNSFDAELYPRGIINSILALPNGKIFVGGKFTDFNLPQYKNLAQMNADGSLVPITYNVNDEVLSLAVDSEGRVLVGGRFTVINANGGSANRSYAARLIDSAHTTPHSLFDFDGDGKTDISIFRPASAQWWLSQSSSGLTVAAQFGASSDKLVPADFTGDGKTDLAVFRPSTGEWFVLRSEDGSFFSFPFGQSGDIPVASDFDGDGKADAGVFRPSTAVWFISASAGGTLIQQFGASGDQPVPSDYDGDGKTDIAIFRPATGEWWLARSSGGVIATSFGTSSDKAVQGDYTGDGKADIAFFRPTTGEWFILRSEDSSFFSFPFGASGDVAAPGDYDGDGKWDAAVFRPSSATWFINRTSAGILITSFGASGDQPVPNAFVP